MAQQYVIDPSALAQIFVSDTLSDHADEVARRAFLRADNLSALRLCSVEFSIVECTNILWKRHSHFGLPLADAQLALDSLNEFPLTIYPARPVMKHALDIAAQYRLAVYDTAYICLADSLRVPLISADQKQIDIAIASGVSVKVLTEFPVTP